MGSVIVLALAYYLSRQSQEVRVGKTVEIKTGKIRGIVSKSRDGRDFYEWLGIPYAQPPVEELRYAVSVDIFPFFRNDSANYFNICCHRARHRLKNGRGQRIRLSMGRNVPSWRC